MYHWVQAEAFAAAAMLSKVFPFVCSERMVLVPLLKLLRVVVFSMSIVLSESWR
jgi:hypothetical protein